MDPVIDLNALTPEQLRQLSGELLGALASREQELASREQELASREQELASSQQELASRQREATTLAKRTKSYLPLTERFRVPTSA